MTTAHQQQPLLANLHSAQHHHLNHARSTTTSSLVARKVPILIICIGIVAVIGLQYNTSTSHSNLLPVALPMKSKDDFLSDSVVEFRKEVSVSGAGSSKLEPGLDHNGTPLHVVFSTSCHDQMHWESFVFFYHAWKVKQPGTVTRIASGCNEEEAEQARNFHDRAVQTMSDRFYLHLTPDFSKQRINGKSTSYKYMNKPFGLRSWMERFLRVNETDRGEGVEDGVVILMDPDMVLLRPLLHDFTHEDVIWVEDNPRDTVVKHGHPMAQQDGYLNNAWMYINGSFITGDPNIGRPKKDGDGPKHWNTGPPYLATVKDMYEISKLWTEYAPRVDHINPGLFAEMQGYIWATFKLDLPHTLIKSIVVSTTESHHREGWAYIDALAENQVCPPPPEATLPIGLHYCKRYALGPDYFFSKYRLKKNFLTCEKNLMEEPPTDIATKYDFFIAPPPSTGKAKTPAERKTFSKKQAKREAFMMCGLIYAVNEAATYWKQHNCGKNANFNKAYTIKNDPGKY